MDCPPRVLITISQFFHLRNRVRVEDGDFFFFERRGSFVIENHKSMGVSKVVQFVPRNAECHFLSRKGLMSWGELAHLGGDYTVKFFYGKNPTKTKRNNDSCQILGVQTSKNIYQSPWWKKTHVYIPLGGPSETNLEARFLEVVRGFTCLEDTLDHYFSPRIIEDGGLRVKTMRKFRRMYPWMDVGGGTVAMKDNFTRWSDEKRAPLGCF